MAKTNRRDLTERNLPPIKRLDQRLRAAMRRLVEHDLSLRELAARLDRIEAPKRKQAR